MSGNGNSANADDESEFDNDEEEGAESTVAMSSPSFDPAMPSPISNPPPGFGPGDPPVQRLQMPPTAPVPFVPGVPNANAGVGLPNAGARPPPSAPMPTPMGGIAPAKPLGAAPPLPAPPPLSGVNRPITGANPSGPAGAIPRRRPQTVVGIAPPAPGAQAPPPQPAPAPPSAPLSPAAPRSSPLGAASTPSSNRTGAPLPPRVAAPAAPAPAAASSEEPWEDDDSQRDDGPTMAGSTEQALALFGLDEAAGNAARAAVGVPAKNERGNDEVATVAVPRDDLERARREAAGNGMATANLPPAIEGETEESTRAVPREELLRAQDAHVVADDDAVGEDATLAVGPGQNEAAIGNQKQHDHVAALAATITADSAGMVAFPPPLGSPGPQAAPAPPPMMGGQGMQPPPWQQQQQQPYPPQHMMQGQPPSNPMMPASSPHPQMGGMPPSNPMMPASSPNPNMGGLPQHMGHMNMQAGAQQQMRMHPQGMNAPVSYPGNQQNPVYPGQGEQARRDGWVLPLPGGKSLRLTGQILLLAVVGVICLAIFVTGIVLFATTKF